MSKNRPADLEKLHGLGTNPLPGIFSAVDSSNGINRNVTIHTLHFCHPVRNLSFFLLSTNLKIKIAYINFSHGDRSSTNQKVAVSIPAGVTGFFIDIKSFRSHYGPGHGSASNRNEYQEYFQGVKAFGA